MIAVSSQDFRNTYEKLYNEIRKYLWPFSVLQELSDVEVDIYSAFIDVKKLRLDFDKLRASMKDVLKDDEQLSKYVNKIINMLDDEDVGSYLRLPRVNETDPNKPKQIKTIPDDKEEEQL